MQVLGFGLGGGGHRCDRHIRRLSLRRLCHGKRTVREVYMTTSVCGESRLFLVSDRGSPPLFLEFHIMNTYSRNKTADTLIPQSLRKELQKLSPESVIVVKTRTRGITSGERQRCYWNANLCAQSFGGKPVYGWWILPPSEDSPGVTRLVGHGCWMNPEGVVVNPTMCNFDEILFLPSSTILQLNLLALQEIPNLYILEDKYDIDALYDCIVAVSSSNFPCRVLSEELFWGCVSKEDLPINKIFLPRFFLKEHVDGFKRLVNTGHSLPDPLLINHLFSPHIETRPEYMYIHTHYPGLSFKNIIQSSTRSASKILKYFAETQTHLGSLKYRDCNRADAVDMLNGQKFYLVNCSSSSGRLIHEIPPCKSLLSQMNLKGNKKKMRKYEKLASQNNLSIHELLLMNDPRYIPHPYLIHKSKKLVRI